MISEMDREGQFDTILDTAEGDADCVALRRAPDTTSRCGYER